MSEGNAGAFATAHSDACRLPLDEAVRLLGEHADEAKILAGGHSLLPMMRFRLAQPSHLVDINRIDGLSYIQEDDGALRIGALTHEADLEAEPIIAQRYPLLSDAIAVIADPLVRNLATVCGNVAHADPAADLADWSATYEDPVSHDWNGWTLCKAGPWSQGPAFLQQLALLPDELPAYGSADYTHLLVEGCKLAMADREAWYGDAAEVPVAELLSYTYNARRRELIGERASHELRPGRPGGREPRLSAHARAVASGTAGAVRAGAVGAGEPTVARGGEPVVAPDGGTRGDTCHLDVVDRWGNMVAATPSGGRQLLLARPDGIEWFELPAAPAVRVTVDSRAAMRDGPAFAGTRRVPPPVNEPVHAYAPGSAERAAPASDPAAPMGTASQCDAEGRALREHQDLALLTDGRRPRSEAARHPPRHEPLDGVRRLVDLRPRGVPGPRSRHAAGVVGLPRGRRSPGSRMVRAPPPRPAGRGEVPRSRPARTTSGRGS